MEFPWLVMFKDSRKPPAVYPIAGCMSELLCHQFILFYSSQIMLKDLRSKMFVVRNHAYKEQVG